MVIRDPVGEPVVEQLGIPSRPGERRIGAEARAADTSPGEMGSSRLVKRKEKQAISSSFHFLTQRNLLLRARNGHPFFFEFFADAI